MDEFQIPKSVDYEIAMLWLKGQDLSEVTPEQAKELFFDALHRIQQTNVERWD